MCISCDRSVYRETYGSEIQSGASISEITTKISDGLSRTDTLYSIVWKDILHVGVDLYDLVDNVIDEEMGQDLR